MKTVALIFTCLLTMFQTKQPATAEMNRAAVAELKTVLQERKMFIKVHAAEYLTWTGNAEIAKEVFLKENQLHGTEPKYRITIWRILAQADKANSQKWISKIYAAYADESGPDRIHASETLAKLKQTVYKKYPEVTDRTIASPESALHLYALWGSGYGSVTRMASVRQKMLHTTLADTDVIAQRISAYVLRFIKLSTIKQWQQLANAAEKNDAASPLFTAYYCSALMSAPAKVSAVRKAKLKKAFLSHVPGFNVGQRTDVSQMLAEVGTAEDLPLLFSFLNNQNTSSNYDASSDEAADLRATAAHAILKINSKVK